jgi:type I restriction enzyme, S subunit
MTDIQTLMPGYDTYKNSRIEWIGKIPSHWDEKKLKALARIENSGDYGFEPEQSEIQSPVATTAQISSDGKFLVDKMPLRGFSANDFKRYLCHVNDILVVKSSGSNSNVISGKAGFIEADTPSFVFSNFLLRIIPQTKLIQPKFLFYQISGYSTKERVKKMVAGSTYPNLKVDEYVGGFFTVPPFSEQTAITNFLDCKTTKIDQTVSIKEKQIQLLKERKQILIRNAVTKGLDPDVPMRDSGVEWIEEIPVHWQVKRAKFLFTEVEERSVTGKEELLSVSHMTGVTPRSEKNVSMFMAEDYTGSKTCQKNDLVINIMWAWMGALGVSDRPGIVSSSYGIFRQLKQGRFNPQYLEYLLKTSNYIGHYNKISTGLHSSRLRFYSHMFFNMEIGFPDRKEQNQIIDHIQTQSAKIDKAVAIQEQMIEKLKEYKTTLINSAVTGKIKVPQTEEAKAVA